MPTANLSQQAKQSLCDNALSCAVFVIFVLLTLLAPLAEPFLAALTNDARLFMQVVLESLCAFLAIHTFTIGWQTFKADRNWSISLLSSFFLGVGLVSISHLLAYLTGHLDTRTLAANVPQKIVVYSIFENLLSALALLSAASLSTKHRISTPARFGLLAAIIVIFTLIVTVATVYPPETAALFIDKASFQTRPAIFIALLCAYTLATVLFLRQYRQSSYIWFYYLALACAMLLLTEVNYALIGTGRNSHPLVGKASQFFAFVFVYRAIYLYAIKWPIGQMDDWKERLKTSQRELHITKLAVENSGHFLFVFDSAKALLYVSDNACKQLGYDKDELLNTARNDLLLFPQMNTQENDWSELRHQGHVTFEDMLQARDGQLFPVDVIITTIEEDSQKLFCVIVHDISERKRYERQREEDAERLRRLIDSIPFFVAILTPEGMYIDTNKTIAESSYLLSDLRGLSMPEFIKKQAFSQDEMPGIDDAFARARSGQSSSIQVHFGNSEIQRYIELSIAPVRDDSGKIINLVVTAADITARILAQNELKLASIVFGHSAEAILITDGNLHTLSINKAFTTITGFNQNDMLGETPQLFLGGKHLPMMNSSLQKNGNWSGEVEWSCKDGHLGYEWVTVTKVIDDRQIARNYIIIFSDISEKKRTEEHIQYLAYYDPLTNLPNRVLLKDRVKQAIAAAKREDHKVAIIFLDLDNFKTINDSLGHQHGDKILSEVAKRLKRNIRECDTVARLGGDEFIVALTDLHDAEEADTISRKLLDELALPYFTGGQELRLTVSIGISLFPEDGDEFSRLIMNADAAMYHAKESGRNNVQFFIGEMNRRAAELLMLENQLRRAIENKELVLHYQPQIDVVTGAIVGFEALVRWHDPENGIIPPAQFIPLAEERGLIKDIGNWVLQEACRQNRAWQDAGLPKLSVAVNISAKQFHDRDFVADVRAALDTSGLEPRYLDLEVTETAVMQDAESLISTLEELQKLGLSLTIDDFGTGYSSLSYLKRFPIDKIKIDRSFIRDIPGDKDDHSIVRAIIGLSQQLNLTVVAEGVETVEQLHALSASLCNQYQGYYFSRPVPPTDAEVLLRGKKPRA